MVESSHRISWQKRHTHSFRQSRTSLVALGERLGWDSLGSGLETPSKSGLHCQQQFPAAGRSFGSMKLKQSLELLPEHPSVRGRGPGLPSLEQGPSLTHSHFCLHLSNPLSFSPTHWLRPINIVKALMIKTPMTMWFPSFLLLEALLLTSLQPLIRDPVATSQVFVCFSAVFDIFP